MKRYFVITHRATENSHVNEQDLLPASCTRITGVAVNATVKQVGQLQEINQQLAFPQALIKDLLYTDRIVNLFYSYLQTRSSEAESKDYFESNILPEIVDVLSNNIRYTCLDADGQQALNNSLSELYNTQFTDYLYNEVELYAKGLAMKSSEFANLIAQQTIVFAYKHKSDVFFRKKKAYERPEPYECGNISLLVNGNSFLLRDYILMANKKVHQINKEIIPFHEPLEVNSNIHTVFKSNKNSGDNTVILRTYIQYEHK